MKRENHSPLYDTERKNRLTKEEEKEIDSLFDMDKINKFVEDIKKEDEEANPHKKHLNTP